MYEVLKRIQCLPFHRPAPLGQQPIKDLSKVEDGLTPAVLYGLLERPGFLFKEWYGSAGVPFSGSYALEVRVYNQLLVGLQGAILSKDFGIASPDYLHHPTNFVPPSTTVPSAVNLKQYNDTSYYHFVTEVLPRLLVWDDDGTTPLLLGIGPLPQYVNEYFELLGYSRSRLVTEPTVKVTGKLYWPTYRPWPHEGGVFPREPLLALRDRLRSKEANKTKTAFVAIRSTIDKQEREVANLSDIVLTLEKAGYKVIVKCCGHISVAEQIKLLSTCSLFVGAAGGDLANILWMPRDSRVIEIHTGAHPHYAANWHLAVCLEHWYYSLFTGNDRKVNLEHIGIIASQP